MISRKMSKRCRNAVEVAKISISALLLRLFRQNSGAEFDIFATSFTLFLITGHYFPSGIVLARTRECPALPSDRRLTRVQLAGRTEVYQSRAKFSVDVETVWFSFVDTETGHRTTTSFRHAPRFEEVVSTFEYRKLVVLRPLLATISTLKK